MARRFEVGRAVTLAGGMLLVASAFLPWVQDGPGSTLRGHELADALVALGREVPGLSATRLTVLWYVVPAAGALVWVTVGWWGAAHVVSRVTSIAAGLAGVVAVAVVARLAGAGDLGVGALAALTGAGAAAAGTVAGRVGNTTRTIGTGGWRPRRAASGPGRADGAYEEDDEVVSR